MKRPDLQGLRGVAIILVLAFHMKPHLFRLGFIGVDMFFVLSGFLMSTILEKKPLSIQIVVDFYRRRFKRIVPLYFVIILSIYIGCWFLLIAPDKEQLVNDLKWALSFTSNIQPIFDVAGYWDQISSYRFFVHAWSLGVEIQFYVIAPIILGYKPVQRIRKPILLIILGIISATFQLFSPASVSYGLLLSRIWQFMCGSLAYETSREEEAKGSGYLSVNAEDKLGLLSDAENGGSPDQPKILVQPTAYSRNTLSRDVIMTVIILLVIFNPQDVSEASMRLFGTVGAAFLISSVQCSSSLLGDRLLVYVGDFSYTLYLVHWPIIVGAKYYLNITDLNLYQIVLLSITMTIVSILIHHTLEHYLMGCDLRVSLVVAASCFLVIGASLSNYCTSSPFKTTAPLVNPNNAFNQTTITLFLNITEAIAWNLAESHKVYFGLPCAGDSVTNAWTNMTQERQLRCQTTGNGTANILVIGNSIAYRAFPLLHSILRGRYSQLRLYSRSACPPISDHCPYFTTAARIVVDKIRPDILFHIHIATEPAFTDKFVDPATDVMFQAFQKHVDYYSARTKHFVIDLPYYVYKKARPGYEIAKRLQQNIPLDDLVVTKDEDHDQEWNHRQRILKLNCSNCIINPVNEGLFDGELYYLYNRTNLHAFTGDGGHLTPEGLNLVRPYYERIIEKLLKSL